MERQVRRMYVILRRKHIAAALCSALALVLVPLGLAQLPGEHVSASKAANTNWGLSFQKEGEPPVGNASADYLKQYGAYYLGDTSKKTIYLTFDAGYENGYTPAILDALKKHNVKATFFVVGNYIQTSPDLVKRMAARGKQVTYLKRLSMGPLRLDPELTPGAFRMLTAEEKKALADCR